MGTVAQVGALCPRRGETVCADAVHGIREEAGDIEVSLSGCAAIENARSLGPDCHAGHGGRLGRGRPTRQRAVAASGRLASAGRPLRQTEPVKTGLRRRPEEVCLPTQNPRVISEFRAVATALPCAPPRYPRRQIMVHDHPPDPKAPFRKRLTSGREKSLHRRRRRKYSR